LIQLRVPSSLGVFVVKKLSPEPITMIYFFCISNHYSESPKT